MNPRSLLSLLKEQDNISITYPLIRNESLCILVHAWSKVAVSWNPPDMIEDPPDVDQELLKLLWSFSEWDAAEVGMMVGLSEETVLQLVQQAAQYGLIFPDGTTSISAKKFLDMKIGYEISKMASGLKKKEPDKKDPDIGGKGN